MGHFTRRSALLSGAAAMALSGCRETEGKGRTDDADKPPMTGTDDTTSTHEWISGLAMAARIASGETTARAEAEAAIARSKAVHEQINAVASETYEQALSDADDPLPGPFSGVPTFIKDLLNWKGAQTLWGSRAFVGNIAQDDHDFAAAWRTSGVVSLGKSTSPEMGLISSTEPLVTGPTRNPWNLNRIPGGSSGGAAALVAARVVPFAHATDGGGSIRIPASCCGVFGLKPSRARLWGRETTPPPVDISVNHAVTITVEDSIALFRAAERNDGQYAPLEMIEPLSRPLRIGFAPRSSSGSLVAPETRAALEDTAQLCRDLGHEVIDMAPIVDADRFLDMFLLYWAGGTAQFAQDASRFTGKPIGPDILEPWTLGLAQMFMSRQAEAAEAVAYLQGFEAQYHSWFDDIDVLLTPVTGRPADPIGEQAPTREFEALMDSVLSFAAFTSFQNVSGAPGMSVPLGWTAADLPIGSHFSAKRGDDALLFSLALQLEDAKPWKDRVPPVSAL